MKWLISLLVFTCLSVKAADFVEINVEGTAPVTDEEQNVRNEILHDAVEKTSQKYIIDMIGEKKFTASKSAVNSVVRQSNKYIPFIKTGDLQKGPENYKMDVHLRLSVNDLKAILTREGLLYENQGAPIVLPVIGFVDRVHSISYQWWSQSSEPQKAMLVGLAKKFESALRSEFSPGGFFATRPVNANDYEIIPPVLRAETPRTEDIMSLGEFFKAQLVIGGQVELDNSRAISGGTRAQIKLTAFHTGTGRFVAEAARNYEIEPGNFNNNVNNKMNTAFTDLAKDLSSQVLEAWKKGTFGAELLKLTLNGHLNYRQLEALKSWMTQNVKEIKGLKERMFEPGKIIFAIDSSGTSQELASHLQSVPKDQFTLKVGQVSADHIEAEVRAN